MTPPAFRHTEHEERHFEAILRAATEHAVIGYSPDGLIDVFSEGARLMLGYEPEEVVGHETPLLFHDPIEIAARAVELGVAPGLDALVAPARNGEPETRDWTYVHRDGARIEVSLSVAPVRNEDGEISAFVTFARDVTRERISQRQLAESEQRLSSLLEATPTPMFVTVAESGEILYANRSVAELFGRAATALVGRTSFDIGGWQQPEDRDEALRRIRSEGRVDDLPRRVTRADGTRLDVLVSLVPIDIEDRPCLIAALRDVTLQRRAERDKVELSTRLRSILDAAGEGIVGVTPEGAVSFVNHAARAMLGHEAERLEGQDFHRLVHPGLLDHGPDTQETCRLRRALGEGTKRRSTSDTFRRHDGSSFPVEYEARPVEPVGRTASGVVLTFADMTERGEIEEQLRLAYVAAERASEAKSEFLSHMSHELRTPLNAILGFAQLLELRGLPPGDVRNDVRHIVRAGEHLLDLINQILDVVRIEAGRLPLSLEPVLVDSVVCDAIGLVEPMALEQEIDVQASIDADLFVVADVQRLKQVFVNLLGNAIKYNRRGGSVRVSATCDREAGRVSIEVVDTGIGIQSERIPLLFAPFECCAGDGSTGEGAGLGLALSAGLAEAMGGSISVESTVGSGSRFVVELAAALTVGDTHPEPRRTRTLPAPSNGGRVRVLYIEDNMANLRLVESVATLRAGVELLVAMHGRLGLDLARRHSPDLVLVDVHLPDMSGEEVVRALKSDDRTARCTIVVVSADATAGRIRRLLEAGASEYLTKPIDVERLLGLFDAAEPRSRVP